MKHIVLYSFLLLVGCSSKPDLIKPGESATTAISEQRIATSEFKREGIKIYYTLFGNIDAIETTGYAPVWGNSQNSVREAYRVAELEAKKSLNDWINKESISSKTSVKMISKNIENAEDTKTNRFANNLTATDEDSDVSDNDNSTNTNDNVAVRNDAIRIATILNNTIITQNRGILGGLFLVKAEPADDGKGVKVVYRWEKDHTEHRLEVRNLMSM